MAGYIKKRTTARRKDVYDMRNEKGIGVALGLAVILGLTGCAGTEEISAEVHEDASTETGTETEADGESKDVKEGSDGTDTTETQAGEWKREEPVSAKEPEKEHAEKDAGESEEPGDAEQSVRASEGTQYLGGKVQSPQTDGMTVSGFVSNLIPVTIGNILGGMVFVALPLYAIHKSKLVNKTK